MKIGPQVESMTTTPEAETNRTVQPVGPLVDACASTMPGAVRLQGRFGAVERLDLCRHGDSLWEALRSFDPLWTYMAFGPFADAGSFSEWLDQRQSIDDPFFYVVVDRSDRALGLAALMSIRLEMRVIEVGNIVLGPSLQRSPLATEAQYLLADYVFEVLGFRRYEWKCDALNAASRRAAQRLGFGFEGIFRNHMIIKGRSRDTAWFAMLDTEWPERRRAFERWLEPANFDAAGRQRTRLEAGPALT